MDDGAVSRQQRALHDLVVLRQGSCLRIFVPEGRQERQRWLGLSEQRFGLDKWHLCRVQAAAICCKPLK